MSDTDTNPETPTPPPTPRHHGLLDKHQLAEITRATTIYGVASDPAIFAQIQDDQIITPAFMTTLGNDLQAIGECTGGVTTAKLDSKQKTGAEDLAKTALLDKIHYIQSKARLKYLGNKDVLTEYALRSNIDISRPALEAATNSILEKLKTDTLPKITPQHSVDLKAALEAYKQTKVAQVVGKGDAATSVTNLEAMVESLKLRRRQLQHAADAEFPFNNPANAGMRIKFDLPTNKPLTA